MGKFYSDDHCIYYRGQESLRSNGETIIVNTRVKMQHLDAASKTTDDLCSFLRQIIQYHSNPSYDSNAKEVEFEQFYEDLQDLLLLKCKKRRPFIIGVWNAKVGSQEIPGVTGKFGLGVQNETGQRLIKFCQENALVIANTFFQQHKRRLYIWTSPGGQHGNQIDYIFCSQSSIQSAKTDRKSTR